MHSKFFLILLLFCLPLAAAEKEAPNHGIVLDLAGLLLKNSSKIEVKVMRNSLEIGSSQVTDALSFIKDASQEFDVHKKLWKEASAALNRRVPDYYADWLNQQRLESLCESFELDEEEFNSGKY